MSSPFPFDDDTEPIELLPDDTGPQRRRTVLALGALAATALAAGAFLLLGTGPEDEALAPGAAPSATTPTTASPSPAATPTQAPLPASSVQLGGRNPFVPLHGGTRSRTAGSPGSGSTGSGSTTTGSTGSGSPTTGSGGTATGSGPSGTPAVDPSDASVVPPVDTAGPGPSVLDPVAPAVGPQLPTDVELGPAGPTSVTLLRVGGSGTARSAVLSLDGTPTTVDVGGAFGPSGELQLVSVLQGPEDGQWTAVLRSGDSDPFDVVSGVRTRLP